MEGDPRAMILRGAEETDSDVIVMGADERTASARPVLGGVAEAVIRKAPCPVLTAKPVPEWKKAAQEKEAKAETGVAVGAHSE